VKTEPFDAARYSGGKEAQAELLNDALTSGNAAYVAQALGVIARARGMAAVAREAGVTREALYKSLSEDGDPQLTTLLGVLPVRQQPTARAVSFSGPMQPPPAQPQEQAPTIRRPPQWRSPKPGSAHPPPTPPAAIARAPELPGYP
jgi:probable addiction module antidote protein